MAGGDAKLLGLQLGAAAHGSPKRCKRGSAPLELDPVAGPWSSAASLRPASCASRPPSPASAATRRSIPSPGLGRDLDASQPAPAPGARSILFNTRICRTMRRICAHLPRDLQVRRRRSAPARWHRPATARDRRPRPAPVPGGSPRPRPCPRASRRPAVSVEDHRHAAEIEMHLDDVARGARLLRHDRHVALGQRIQQARLAGIGRTGDDDAEAVAQALAAAGRRDGARSTSRKHVDDGAGLDADIGRPRRLRRRNRVRPRPAPARASSSRAPAFVELPQRAFAPARSA